MEVPILEGKLSAQLALLNLIPKILLLREQKLMMKLYRFLLMSNQ